MPMIDLHRCFIVAELSANHMHDYERAVSLIKLAKEAGADAVKLQTYTADTLTLNCKNKYFIVKDPKWAGYSLHEVFLQAYTPWEWQPKLKKIVEDLGMVFFSTPFDHTAVDFLEKMNVPCYKISSFELIDLPLIQRVAATGKPLFLSTGMGSESEIEEAVALFKNSGGTDLVLLKCTSAYPAPAEETNLLTIPYMRDRFGVSVGLSDHSLGIEVPLAAVTLGACVIEKHFCLSREEEGPDSFFSLEPQEFKAMVNGVRKVEAALGKVSFEVTPKQMACLVTRRSLFVAEDIKAGEIFTARNVRSVRPGHGLHTRYYDEIMGKCASKNIKFGTPLNWAHVKTS